MPEEEHKKNASALYHRIRGDCNSNIGCDSLLHSLLFRLGGNQESDKAELNQYCNHWVDQRRAKESLGDVSSASHQTSLGDNELTLYSDLNEADIKSAFIR